MIQILEKLRILKTPAGRLFGCRARLSYFVRFDNALTRSSQRENNTTWQMLYRLFFSSKCWHFRTICKFKHARFFSHAQFVPEIHARICSIWKHVCYVLRTSGCRCSLYFGQCFGFLARNEVLVTRKVRLASNKFTKQKKKNTQRTNVFWRSEANYNAIEMQT